MVLRTDFSRRLGQCAGYANNHERKNQDCTFDHLISRQSGLSGHCTRVYVAILHRTISSNQLIRAQQQ
jgi:hypothetical protein